MLQLSLRSFAEMKFQHRWRSTDRVISEGHF
jgi:hypothetical protein